MRNDMKYSIKPRSWKETGKHTELSSEGDSALSGADIIISEAWRNEVSWWPKVGVCWDK